MKGKTENEVAAVPTHLKKLLRLKNWLRSPLFRLPTGIIFYILSYIIEDGEHSIWQSVFNICNHIRDVMNTATELRSRKGTSGQ